MRNLIWLLLLCSCFKNEPQEEAGSSEPSLSWMEENAYYPYGFIGFDTMMEHVPIEHARLLGRSKEYTFAGTTGNWSPELNVASLEGAERRLSYDGERVVISTTAFGEPGDQPCTEEMIYERLPTDKPYPVIGNNWYCQRACYNAYKDHMANGEIRENAVSCFKPINESSVGGMTMEIVETDLGIDLITTLLDENNKPDVYNVDSYRRQ